jgi:hypothetical protein
MTAMRHILLPVCDVADAKMLLPLARAIARSKVVLEGAIR